MARYDSMKNDKEDSGKTVEFLTVDNVFNQIIALPEFQGHYFGELLEIAPEKISKLESTSFPRPADEFQAYIKEWLSSIDGEEEKNSGKGEMSEVEGEEYKPSWRRLVWALDMLELDEADLIRPLAEPHTDSTFTTENVSTVLNFSPLLLEDWENTWSEWSLSLPTKQLEKIKLESHDSKERNRAAAQYLVEVNPYANWLEVAREMYEYSQFEALDEVRKYLPPKDSSLSAQEVCKTIPDVTCDWKIVWGRDGVGIPPLVLDHIAALHQGLDAAQVYRACAEVYVKYDPEASWVAFNAAVTNIKQSLK